MYTEVEIQQAFIQFVRLTYSQRKAINKRYSIRALARDLSLDSSTLSQILSGKRKPTLASIEKVLRHLKLDLSALFEATVQPFDNIGEDHFTVIADWYHVAILDMTLLKDFQSNPKWIAAKLNLPQQSVELAIARLLKLELLELKDGEFRKSTKLLTNDLGARTNLAKKTYQKQIIKMALAAVDSVPQEEKDISSMSIAVSRKNLDQARLLIKAFRRKLCDLLESEPGDEVYHLGIQLYPVSGKKENAG